MKQIEKKIDKARNHTSTHAEGELGEERVGEGGPRKPNRRGKPSRPKTITPIEHARRRPAPIRLSTRPHGREVRVLRQTRAHAGGPPIVPGELPQLQQIPRHRADQPGPLCISVRDARHTFGNLGACVLAR